MSGSRDLSIYLNYDLIAKVLDAAEVRRAVAEATYGAPHIQPVYTRDQLLTGVVPEDETSRRVMNGYNRRRGPPVSAAPLIGSSRRAPPLTAPP